MVNAMMKLITFMTNRIVSKNIDKYFVILSMQCHSFISFVHNQITSFKSLQLQPHQYAC